MYYPSLKVRRISWLSQSLLFSLSSSYLDSHEIVVKNTELEQALGWLQKQGPYKITVLCGDQTFSATIPVCQVSSSQCVVWLELHFAPRSPYEWNWYDTLGPWAPGLQLEFSQVLATAGFSENSLVCALKCCRVKLAQNICKLCPGHSGLLATRECPTNTYMLQCQHCRSHPLKTNTM